jgi:FkbM family methyltransferase
MRVQSLRTRLTRLRTFVREASSLKDIPALAIAAVARDNPFGHDGTWSSTLGRCFGVVKVRTHATAGELALIDTHDLGHLVSCEELLIEKTYDLSLVPFQPDVVVDCGSHIGLFSLIAGLHYPRARLIAYEPDPSNFRLAERQLARFATRLRLVEAAVSTVDGEAWFSRSDSNSGHFSRSDIDGQLLVRTIDLAADVPQWRAERLLLKMDIEGAERQVLPQLVSHFPKQCALFLESHGGKEGWNDLSGLLSKAGFQVSTKRERGLFVDGFALRV